MPGLLHAQLASLARKHLTWSDVLHSNLMHHSSIADICLYSETKQEEAIIYTAN